MVQVAIGDEQASQAAPEAPPASTRERILAAAADVFAERGYEGAAVSDIARRAGFTTGAIYGRFRDKAELLLEVVQGVLESQQEAAVLAASAGDSGVSSRLGGTGRRVPDGHKRAARAPRPPSPPAAP